MPSRTVLGMRPKCGLYSSAMPYGLPLSTLRRATVASLQRRDVDLQSRSVRPIAIQQPRLTVRYGDARHRKLGAAAYAAALTEITTSARTMVDQNVRILIFIVGCLYLLRGRQGAWPATRCRTWWRGSLAADARSGTLFVVDDQHGPVLEIDHRRIRAADAVDQDIFAPGLALVQAVVEAGRRQPMGQGE